MENLSSKTVKIGALVAAVVGSSIFLAACGNSANTQSAAPAGQTQQTTPTTDAGSNTAAPTTNNTIPVASSAPTQQAAQPTVAPITNINSEGNSVNALDQQGTAASQSLNDQPGNVQ